MGRSFSPPSAVRSPAHGRRGWQRMRGLLIAAEADDWRRNREAIGSGSYASAHSGIAPMVEGRRGPIKK